MNFIELDEMIVPGQADRLVRAVVQQIVRNANTYSANVDVVSVRALAA